MKNIFLVFLLAGCTTLKPIEDTKLEVPQDLDQEVQAKFEIKETSAPKMIPVKVVEKKIEVKTVKKTKELIPEQLVEQERKFKPFIGEKLTYSVYAPMGIKAGTLIAHVVGEKTINQQLVVHLKANIYNTSFFASIFKVNLLIESFVDPYDFKSLRYQISGQEGSIRKQNIELYDYEKNKIFESKLQTTSEGSKNINKEHEVLTVSTAQDILSAFYRVKHHDFQANPSINFAVASGSKVKQARVVKLRTEKWNNLDCLVVGLSFEPNEPVEKKQIWIDQNHRVVQIIADMKWGKFKILLE